MHHTAGMSRLQAQPQAGLQEEVAEGPRLGAVQRGHVLLVLDSALQSLPWESLPGLRQQR